MKEEKQDQNKYVGLTKKHFVMSQLVNVKY